MLKNIQGGQPTQVKRQGFTTLTINGMSQSTCIRDPYTVQSLSHYIFKFITLHFLISHTLVVYISPG